MTGSALANARCSPSERRVVGFALAVLAVSLGFSATAQEGCESVPPERREQCQRVLDCLVIDDVTVRRACIEAAQAATPAAERPAVAERAAARQAVTQGAEASDAEAPDLEAPDVEVPQAEAVAEAEPLVPEPSVAADPPDQPEQSPQAPAEAPQTVSEATPALEEQVVMERRTPPAAPEAPAEAAPLELREPPDKFSGEVSNIFQSVLDRQVIAIDGMYLFESERAAPARLKVGQLVEVERAMSRFRRSGRTWRITGPNRHAFDATRIRCESDTVAAGDRRRCAQMLDR